MAGCYTPGAQDNGGFHATRPLVPDIAGRAIFAQPPTAATLPSEWPAERTWPYLRIDDNQLPDPLTLIAYGDQRFTDPANTRQTNPRIRSGW